MNALMGIMNLLLLPLSVAAGWYGAKFLPRAYRVVSLMMPMIGAWLLATLAVTGAAQVGGETHRWTGHYYVIFFWLTLPIASGGLLQAKVKGRPVIALLQCAVLFSGLLLALLAGFTGYLGPSYNPAVVAETHRRFLLLHGILLPGGLTLVQALWLWFVWPRPKKEPETA